MKRIVLIAVPVLLVSASLVRAQSPQPAITLPQAQYFVSIWYQQFLGRLPDPGAAVWVLGLVNGRPAGDVLADIIGSREFFTLAGGTNAGFVARLYQTQLGRAPTPAELLFWTNVLLNRSRKFVALQFLTSQGNIANVQIPNRQRHRR
jgi:hypothetical protein